MRIATMSGIGTCSSDARSYIEVTPSIVGEQGCSGARARGNDARRSASDLAVGDAVDAPDRLRALWVARRLETFTGEDVPAVLQRDAVPLRAPPSYAGTGRRRLASASPIRGRLAAPSDASGLNRPQVQCDERRPTRPQGSDPRRAVDP